MGRGRLACGCACLRVLLVFPPSLSFRRVIFSPAFSNAPTSPRRAVGRDHKNPVGQSPSKRQKCQTRRKRRGAGPIRIYLAANFSAERDSLSPANHEAFWVRLTPRNFLEVRLMSPAARDGLPNRTYPLTKSLAGGGAFLGKSSRAHKTTAHTYYVSTWVECVCAHATSYSLL